LILTPELGLGAKITYLWQILVTLTPVLRW